MTDCKWTPGPWAVNGGGNVIAEVGGFLWIHSKAPLGSPQSDAHLMAAARDLYNALEVLATYAELKGIPTNAAHAAMAKARGEIS